MMNINLILTDRNEAISKLIKAIQKKPFAEKTRFKHSLSQVLDTLFCDWNLSIYDAYCFGNVEYNADDIATLITFGSPFDLQMAETITVKNSYLESRFNSIFYDCLKEILIGLSFKTFTNEDFLQDFDNKFDNLSIEELSQHFCLESLFSKAS